MAAHFDPRLPGKLLEEMQKLDLMILRVSCCWSCFCLFLAAQRVCQIPRLGVARA